MKLKPEIYAQALIASLKDDNKKKVARSFWYQLQKNGQYKDLHKILDQLDIQFAKQNGFISAKAYSAKSLTEHEIEEMRASLKKRYGKEVIIKNIVKKGKIAGVTVKVDDAEIDLSVEGKINKLKQIFK